MLCTILPAYSEDEALVTEESNDCTLDLDSSEFGVRVRNIKGVPLENTKNTVKALGQLIRPKQWVKNSFVMVGMLFSQNWGHVDLLLKAITAAIAFCFVSSAVYVLNDFLDRERDRMHPKKCHRPLASGAVTPRVAGVIFLFFLLIGMLLGLAVSSIALGILLYYLAQNIAYSKGLKQVVLLDVLLIAFGFMLRILMGTWGVGIAPSKWLLLSGLTLALFMGFGKRWAELNDLLTGASAHRPVLKNYSLELLNQLLGITAGAVILTYSLYVIDPSTVILHHTTTLIYTVPFVIYGLWRYLYLIRIGKGGDPSKLVTKDPHIIVAVLLWLTSVLYILS
ncbi:decaprenyl-phosphate phosphoribosyltransferase [Desulfosporosinus metallidurans]|uniref:Decaprenyl-phosphate phosphoribosyltransferase n=1 Tax=Desulfosporosinus metallidurans TaxID=1888891 RepID=A0A1Q8QSA3_9FIRM|nr:decaprenyl-phosphate phosphoribosyltransferase [Desulfosporosinus metallidurans]OLN30224.1 hypothetical protein DSOL_3167 [Desulfosporosinus metallidurans]